MKDNRNKSVTNNNKEFVNCLICQSDKHDIYLHAPDRFKIDKKFRLVRCRNCGFIFLNPRPDKESISVYYENEEYQPHQTEAKSFTEKMYESIRKWNNRYKRKLIGKKIQTGKILDYGCGTGDFLCEMQNHGWKTYGYEPSVKASSKAMEYGIQMIENIESLPYQMDVITMWHALEHVHDTGALLTQVHEKLNVNGLLVIAVPNLICFDAIMYKEYWVAYDAPRHLYHFNPSDMDALLKSYKFKLLAIHRLYPDPLYNTLLSAQIEKTAIRRNVFSVMTKMLFTAFISFLINLFYKNRSSSVIYFACKA